MRHCPFYEIELKCLDSFKLDMAGRTLIRFNAGGQVQDRLLTLITLYSYNSHD